MSHPPLAPWQDDVFVGCSPDASAEQVDTARHVAEQLSLPLGTSLPESTHPTRFRLAIESGAWCLFPPTCDDTFGRQPLWVDFVHDPRFNQPMALREPLAKAVGLRANRRPLVLDLTAGLGRDAWALASTGCPVMAFERHPLVAFLLADGLRRASLHGPTAPIADRITLCSADPRTVDLAVVDAKTVWLFDPMFPERRKSALVKKAMRIFQRLVGEDDDAAEVFSWARAQPGGRWVVKRPPQAPRIDGSVPSMEISSGRIRFDCYL